jgi:hypothetical protein
MATINFEIEPFPVPTGVTIKLPTSGKREDGMKPGPTLALTELSEETLASLCEEFTVAVFAAAGKSL